MDYKHARRTIMNAITTLQDEESDDEENTFVVLKAVEQLAYVAVDIAESLDAIFETLSLLA